MPSHDEDVGLVARIDAVPAILEVACRLTGMRFAAVARVTEDSWTACAVRDELDFGLGPGGTLDISTTICNQVRGSGKAVVIDHVTEDGEFCGHPVPKMYGFQSYISMPIIRTNGEFFGTLCALDPLPAKLSDPTVVTTFKLFAELIAVQLDSQQRLERSQAALLDVQEAAELREQFVAVLGHDLRNPLAAIEAGTRLLADAPLDERSARIVAMMQDSCRRMGRLISDVVDFARGRLGGGLPVELQAEPALQEVLEHVVQEAATTFPARSFETAIELAEPVVCDSSRIAQLLSNLLDNALQHGDADMPVLVRARSSGGKFTLEVENRGNPIPREEQDKLFHPFTRAGGGSRRRGLGLGLYIVAEIAKAHGGVVSVSSTADKTSFALVMPNQRSSVGRQ